MWVVASALHSERAPGMGDPIEQPAWRLILSCWRWKIDGRTTENRGVMISPGRNSQSNESLSSPANSMASILYRMNTCTLTSMPDYKLHRSQATCFKSTQLSERCAIEGLPADMKLPQKPAVQHFLPTKLRAWCTSDNLVRHGDSQSE